MTPTPRKRSSTAPARPRPGFRCSSQASRPRRRRQAGASWDLSWQGSLGPPSNRFRSGPGYQPRRDLCDGRRRPSSQVFPLLSKRSIVSSRRPAVSRAGRHVTAKLQQAARVGLVASCRTEETDERMRETRTIELGAAACCSTSPRLPEFLRQSLWQAERGAPTAASNRRGVVDLERSFLLSASGSDSRI